ncbi:hypothetical protein [Serratia marcescens]|uniref:hypothetical protein n=1 Tax=Serratia marcescens TaxID=615 RepID=UPI001495A9D5|nr:hypothetical protein [Serratia marcescens]
MTEVLTYEALKAECDALADRVERLSSMLTESRVATKSAEERADALAVENKGLKMKAAFIEARGVDKFADSQIAYVRKNRAELDPMTRAAYCGSATDARRFADELREAK